MVEITSNKSSSTMEGLLVRSATARRLLGGFLQNNPGSLHVLLQNVSDEKGSLLMGISVESTY
jgi:hypothetical protein